jgi:hypothetical protein
LDANGVDGKTPAIKMSPSALLNINHGIKQRMHSFLFQISRPSVSNNVQWIPVAQAKSILIFNHNIYWPSILLLLELYGSNIAELICYAATNLMGGVYFLCWWDVCYVTTKCRKMDWKQGNIGWIYSFDNKFHNHSFALFYPRPLLEKVYSPFLWSK